MSVDFVRPDIIRPPSEWNAYYLPLTKGCSNNTCAFCNFYGKKLQIRDVEEVKLEIDVLHAFMTQGLVYTSIPQIIYMIARQWDGGKVFLQDGDALVYPYPKLIEILQHLNDRFPRIDRIATYATPRDILRLSHEQLLELKKQKLGIFYMGLESGDAEVLQKINKGVNREEMVEAGSKVKDAGISLSVSLILGLGGVAGSERHAHESAKILTEIDPDYAGALTLTLVPGTPLYEAVEKGSFELITPFHSLEELRILVDESKFTKCYFSSLHASNYLSVKGWLPRDKEKMLADIDKVLATKDPSLLRPEYLRGL